MDFDRETLSILQFIRLLDKDGVGQSHLVIYNSSIVFPPGAQHSTTWLPEWRSQGLISGREGLGQSAISIALYQGPMDTFLDSTNYPLV